MTPTLVFIIWIHSFGQPDSYETFEIIEPINI